MYNAKFGLRKNPFNLTPDPSFLLLTDQHREALCGLTYALLQRRGFVTLSGEVGTGKTTLVARLLQFLPPGKLHFSMILNPTLTPSEFLEMALLDFGLTDIPTSKAQRLWKLQDLLVANQREGKVSALIVDEAHRLSPAVLEEIRMLGNFEQAEYKMLQILLVGQSELDEILNREDMRQLKQRIAVRLTLGPLEPEQVAGYMQHRWTSAGGSELPFTPAAVACITDASQGIPRLINSLADNALLVAFALKSSLVEVAHVHEAATNLNLCALPRPKETVKTEAPARLKPDAPSPVKTQAAPLRTEAPAGLKPQVLSTVKTDPLTLVKTEAPARAKAEAPSPVNTDAPKFLVPEPGLLRWSRWVSRIRLRVTPKQESA